MLKLCVTIPRPPMTTCKRTHTPGNPSQAKTTHVRCDNWPLKANSHRDDLRQLHFSVCLWHANDSIMHVLSYYGKTTGFCSAPFNCGAASRPCLESLASSPLRDLVSWPPSGNVLLVRLFFVRISSMFGFRRIPPRSADLNRFYSVAHTTAIIRTPDALGHGLASTLPASVIYSFAHALSLRRIFPTSESSVLHNGTVFFPAHLSRL